MPVDPNTLPNDPRVDTPDPLNQNGLNTFKGIVGYTNDWKLNWKGRERSSNVEVRTSGSPDERQVKNRELAFLDAEHILELMRQPPLPRADPRGRSIQVTPGQRMSMKDFLAAREDSVNRERALNRTSKWWWKEGYKQANFWEVVFHGAKNSASANQVGKEHFDQEMFLLDSFKRAREVGYPIHSLIPTKQFDPRPSDKFTTEAYDY